MNPIPFLVLSAVVIVLPRRDMALVGRNAPFGGRRVGVFTAFGIGLATADH